MIITSVLDTDYYTFLMGQVAWMKWPDAEVEYRLINRNKVRLTSAFLEILQKEIHGMSLVHLSVSEANFLKTTGHFSGDYIDSITGRPLFDPSKVTIDFNDDGGLTIKGKWHEVIFWETPLLATMSELFYQTKGVKPLWNNRLAFMDKFQILSGLKWSEFGTRRRFSKEVQEDIVDIAKNTKGFLGTSNPLLAMKHDVPVVGTMAHQGPMMMQALVGLPLSTLTWMDEWEKVYRHMPGTSIFIPDTLGTPDFLNDFDCRRANAWAGVRQDSGDPAKFTRWVIAKYRSYDIDTTKKTIVYSDRMDPFRLQELTNRFGSQIMVVGGLGTNLTNNCGHVPLDLVIKPVRANFNGTWVPIVKLSDDPSKATGVKR